MVFITSVAFVVFEILPSLVSMQKTLNEITADKSKISKTVHVTSPLFLVYFHNMKLVLCQTKFPWLQKHC